MRNEDGAKAGAKIVDYTTIIPQVIASLFGILAKSYGRILLNQNEL